MEDEGRLVNIGGRTLYARTSVVTASVPFEVGGHVGNVNLGQAHQRMVERVPRVRHLFAEKSSHRTMVSEEPELIVDLIRSMLDPGLGRKY